MSETAKKPESACWGCRFWKEIDDGEGYGFCRRRSPPPYTGNHLTDGELNMFLSGRWPTTLMYAWCGEYEPDDGRLLEDLEARVNAYK